MTAGTLALLAMPLAGLILGLAAFGIARRGARHDHPRIAFPPGADPRLQGERRSAQPQTIPAPPSTRVPSAA